MSDRKRKLGRKRLWLSLGIIGCATLAAIAARARPDRDLQYLLDLHPMKVTPLMSSSSYGSQCGAQLWFKSTDGNTVRRAIADHYDRWPGVSHMPPYGSGIESWAASTDWNLALL